jgi:hypothetical protein
VEESFLSLPVQRIYEVKQTEIDTAEPNAFKDEIAIEN